MPRIDFQRLSVNNPRRVDVIQPQQLFHTPRPRKCFQKVPSIMEMNMIYIKTPKDIKELHISNVFIQAYTLM